MLLVAALGTFVLLSGCASDGGRHHDGRTVTTMLRRIGEGPEGGLREGETVTVCSSESELEEEHEACIHEDTRKVRASFCMSGLRCRRLHRVGNSCTFTSDGEQTICTCTCIEQTMPTCGMYYNICVLTESQA